MKIKEEQILRDCWAELYPEASPRFEQFFAELKERRENQSTTIDNPKWYQDAVIYSLYVDLFNTNFPGLVEKLDYLQSLGVTCLWLLPILDSPMKDVGFDIRRYDRVREELLGLPSDATDEEKQAGFRDFLDAAHERGLRVIFDIALNHTSEEHEWFLKAKSSKDSPYRDYYVWSDTDEKYEDARLLFKGMCPSNWEKCGDQYYFHRFYEFQPDLNYRNPEVLLAMCGHLLYWLDQGVDGFRTDAIPFIWKEIGTNCENLPTVHVIVKFIRAVLDYVKPGILMLAEACQPPKDVVEYFGTGDECHAAYHFPLMPQIFISLALHKSEPIKTILDTKHTPAIPDGCQWFIFLRCHDELTLEMVTPEERDIINNYYLHDPRWTFREGEGVSARLADLFEQDPKRIALAYSIMLTLCGTPIVYYGDEYGRRNDEQYFEQMKKQLGYTDSRYFVRGEVNWENVESELSDPDSLSAKVFEISKQQINTRQKYPSFGRGSLNWVDGNEALLAYIREYEGEKIFVLHNLSTNPIKVDGVNISKINTDKDLLDQKLNISESNELELGAYEYRWILLAS